MENKDTPIGTIFLSRDLQIRHFTLETQQVFDLIQPNSDVSIPDLARKLHHNALTEDAANVLLTLQPLEREVLAANGNTYTVRLSPCRTMDNQIEGVVLNVIEITERKKAEAALRETQQQNTDILESITDAFFALDQEWRFTYINRYAYLLLDREPGDLLGKVIWDEYPGLIGSVFEPAYLQAGNEGIASKVTAFYPDHDRWYEVHLHPATKGITVYFQNVTERKQAEADLRETQRQNTEILDSITDAFFALDQDWRFNYVNRQAEIMLDRNPGDLLGKVIWEEYAILGTEFERAYRQTANEQIATTFTAFYPQHQRWYEVHAYPATNGISVYFQNATERKQAEVALRESGEKYRTLFNSMDEGYCILEMMFDENGKPNNWRFLEVNPAFEKNNGLVEASGKTILELAPDIEPKWVETYGKVASTGEAIRFEESSAALNRWFDLYAFRVGEPEERKVAVLFKNITHQKRYESNLAFLSEISRDLVQLTDIEEMMNNVGAKIGAYLQVAQCLFAQINEAQDHVLVEYVWHNETSSDLTGEYQLSTFVTEEFQQAARARETIVIHNTQTDTRTDAESYAAFNIYAFVTVPFHQGAEWKYLLTVNDAQPRDWREDEVELIRELADRLFQRLERARNEEALRRSEQELRLITDAIPALISYVDAEHRYRFVNKMYTQWFGYQPEDIVGKHVREIVGEVVYELVLPDMKRVLAGEELTFEKLLVYKNVGARYVHVDYIPDIQPNGKVKGYYALVQDITERARAEEALRNSEDRFRLASQAVQAVIYDWNVKTNHVERSHELINLLGFEPTAAEVATNDWYRARVHPDDDERATKVVMDTIQSQSAIFSDEHRVQHQDGHYVWVHDSGVFLYDADGNAIRCVGSITDITERKQAEEALRDADRRKNEFLATLAHELRNPLTPIRSALEILNKSDNKAQEARARLIIERQIRKIVILVDDLLEISRITRGKIQLHKEVISLQAVLKDVLETTEPLMTAAGHQFTLQMPAELVCIDADDVRIAQILINIVNNAIKYTNNGGQIFLTVTTENDQVVIRIKDNGIGIPTDRLESIFEIFEQVEHHGKKFQSGLGIGLSLAKELTQLHGGTITAHSEGEGKGSEFILRFPLAEDQTPLNDEPPCEDEPTIPAFEGNRKRILVVEDDIDIADMLQQLLELENYKVQIANSGESALRVANEFQPEAALVDIGLPDMDGHEVAQRLRKEHPNLLLIAHSGWGAEEDFQRSKEAGFDYHLVKPAEMEEILALLTKGSGV